MAITTADNLNQPWHQRTGLYWVIGIVAVLALIAFAVGRTDNSRNEVYPAPARDSSVPAAPNSSLGTGTGTSTMGTGAGDVQNTDSNMRGTGTEMGTGAGTGTGTGTTGPATGTGTDGTDRR